MALELPKEELPTVSVDGHRIINSKQLNMLSDNMGLRRMDQTDEEIMEQLEILLLERIHEGDTLALFQLGQLYYEQEEYAKARKYFESAEKKLDLQACFQLGVILYDGLGCETDQKTGFKHMMKVATSNAKVSEPLIRAAQYNIGRAYYMGYGAKQSNEMAEKFWLLAADDGDPKASVKAQTALGLFYTQEEQVDLQKSFFWHSEACGNGSLESQGAMGVMYLTGLCGKQDEEAAFICLREAAERGNVFAMGHMVAYYYKRKLFTKAVDLAMRVAQMTNVDQIAEETDCVPAYISKGIAMACFYYARCLHHGRSTKKDDAEAKCYYSKAYQFDPVVCADLQLLIQHGEI